MTRPLTLLLGAMLVLALSLNLHFDIRDPGEAMVVGGRDVAVWWPPVRRPAALIVFSHGYGTCPTQSSFLTRALARAGYLVVAPRHQDASCPGKTVFPAGAVAFMVPDVWSAKTGRGRHDDIVAVLEGLRVDPAFAGRIDWSRLVLMGHSLGGYTVLGLAGAWPDWGIPGVRAVVGLSPTCAPFLQPSGRLDAVTAPVLYQTGLFDTGIAPAVRQPNGCFDRTPTAALVVFREADHMAWTDGPSVVHRRIVAQTLRFLDATTNGGGIPPIRPRESHVAEWRAKDSGVRPPRDRVP